MSGDLGGAWCPRCYVFVRYAPGRTSGRLATHDARGVECLGSGGHGFGTVPFGTPPCDRPDTAMRYVVVPSVDADEAARLRAEVARLTTECEEHRSRAAAMRDDRNALRSASRALAGIDVATLDAVTPAAMRAVMERRGWTLDARLPWFGDPAWTAFESWEHPTAQGAGSRGGSARFVPDVRVAVLPGIDAAEARRYVAEWAWSLATRHGDVSPAEVLAEALAAGVSS